MKAIRYACIIAAMGAVACGAAPSDREDELSADAPPTMASAEPCDGDIRTQSQALEVANETRPLLVILLQRDKEMPLARTDAWYDGRIFGPGFPNVVGYFSAISKNRFNFTRTQVVSVVDRQDADFLDRAGVTSSTSGTNSARLRSLMLADDAGFPFENFDANGDGRITTSELAVLTIDNYSQSSGQTGAPGCVTHPGDIDVCTSVSLTGHQSNLANYVHELSHQLGTRDIYGTACHSQNQTIMSCTTGGVEGATLQGIDPWHREELGWGGRRANVSGSSGTALLQPVSTYAGSSSGVERLVLERGTNQEVLYIENRTRNGGYERDNALEGIVFWYTKTTADGEKIIQIPQLGDNGTDGAHFVLAPVGCVGDPMNPNSRGRTTTPTTPGSTYRVKWADGTDTGFLFTIGSPTSNGSISVSWTQTDKAATCPEAPPGSAFAWVNVSNGTVHRSYSFSTARAPITVSSTSTGIYRVTFEGLARTGGTAQAVAYGSDNVRCKVGNWYSFGNDQRVHVYCHHPDGTRADSRFVVRFWNEDQEGDAAAYLWAERPTSSSYSPSSLYRWNSTGGANRITRTGTGAYSAYLPGLAAWGGSAHVTAYGSGSEYCKVLNWGPSGSDQRVNVRCFDSGGAPTDTRFILEYRGHQQVGLYDYGAHAWAHDASSSSYTPFTWYSYNSNDRIGCVGPGTNTAGRYGTGSYFIRHSDLSPTQSAAHVTAYGSDSAYCKVRGWYWSSNGVEVRSRCYDASGAPADSQYTESYTTSRVRGPC